MTEKEEILGKSIRKVLKIGRSLALTIPKEYVDAHEIKPGDLFEAYYNESLHNEPLRREDIERKTHRGERSE